MPQKRTEPSQVEPLCLVLAPGLKTRRFGDCSRLDARLLGNPRLHWGQLTMMQWLGLSMDRRYLVPGRFSSGS